MPPPEYAPSTVGWVRDEVERYGHYVLYDPPLIGPVGEVGAQRAAAVGRAVGIDPPAAAAEDASPARGQPGQVATKDLVRIGWVDELHERTGKDQVDFGHRSRLRGG